jgi:hypothetical protein
MREGPGPVDLMEHLRRRKQACDNGAASDLTALNAILEDVNDGKVVIQGGASC